MNLINNSLLAYYVRRARRARRPTWTPAALFAQGQQGAWYEPKPEYLFQDAEGTVPVTADGDPVGLMLDRSRGLELGPNELGTFNLASWPLHSRTKDVTTNSFFVDDGQSNGGVIYRVGRSGVQLRYRAVVHYTRLSAGGDIALTVGSASTAKEQARQEMGGSGTITASRVLDTNNSLFIRLYGAGAGVRIDAIEFQEVLGNHAAQSTSAERPVSSDTPPLQVYDNVDDAMNVTLPAIAAATVAIATPTGADIQYPVDLSSGSYTITESHSGIIIREGELTAAEQQQVTDYLNAQAGV